MGFTVAHKGGTKDSEYQAYVRLLSRRLLQQGIGLDELPRVSEEGGNRAWLYVWDSQDEAAAFARELQEQTGDSDWLVQEVKGKPSLGPLRPLQINVGRQQDGWAFALEPLSRKAIQIKYPGSCRFNKVFVGSQSRDDFLAARGELQDLAEQVLSILTGLGAEQLQSFGSFRVVDPVDDNELLAPSPLTPVSAR